MKKHGIGLPEFCARYLSCANIQVGLSAIYVQAYFFSESKFLALALRSDWLYIPARPPVFRFSTTRTRQHLSEINDDLRQEVRPLRIVISETEGLGATTVKRAQNIEEQGAVTRLSSLSFVSKLRAISSKTTEGIALVPEKFSSKTISNSTISYARRAAA